MKLISQRLFFALFLLITTSIQAQYTEVINSNKPGFSESPYSVGKGVYQLESSFFFRNTAINSVFSKPQSLGADFLLRTSFLSEKLEFNTQVTYQQDKIAFKNIFTSHYYSSGLSRFTVGAKYLLFQPKYEDKSKEVRSWKKKYTFDIKRLIPSVGIYAGVNTNVLNEIHQIKTISPKAGVLLQQSLSTDFNIISNFYLDKIGTDFQEFSYIVTGTQNFNDRWSAFFEGQGVYQKIQTNTNLGAGFAFLFSKNLQINTSARYLVEGNTQGFYGGLGLSYRVDNHKDSFKNLDENGRELIDTPIKRYNRKQTSFFGRLFGVFKKSSLPRSTRKKDRKRRN